MKTEILKVENLTKTYKVDGHRVDAVKDVSFSLVKGEFLGIVGESGSGKSTILKQIACLENPDQGKIFLEDTDIAHARPKDVCKKLQMVYQDARASFNPRMTILQSMKDAMEHLSGIKGKAAEEKCAELASLVGLSADLLHRKPEGLSGGQCQRMALARTLVTHPALLLCDEATSALDVSAQAQLLRLLVNLKAEFNLSVLFVTHDLAVVSGLCDRVIVMKDGRIVESGTPSVILHTPETEYTKELVSSIYTVDR